MTQDEALAILKTGANVFLTGEPGSGKTYVVNCFISWLREHNIEPAVTASTGIAATHINGRTIHSWSGIGIRDHLDEYDIERIASNKQIARRVRSARTLIIDEISMLSAPTFSMVDAVCRAVRNCEMPFGGLQVVLVGDFFQLPPVVTRATSEGNIFEDELWQKRESSQSLFAFNSPVWDDLDLKVCYLSEQYRQDDQVFLEILSAIRSGTVAEQHRSLLKTRLARQGLDGITQFFSHNIDVDRVNNAKLSKLPGHIRTFIMESRGPKQLTARLVQGCLSPETLMLKIGARVMFTKNDIGQHRFVNGTLGVIAGFSKENGNPIVRTNTGRTIFTEPADWSIEESGRLLARITQIPLRLAWAITVHKSQGMSLDAAHMDLSDAFEYGQGYVAISRVRTLAGLSLSGFNERSLEVHPGIVSQDVKFRGSSREMQEKLALTSTSEILEQQNNFIRVCGGRVKPVKIAEKAYSGPIVKIPQKERRWERTLALIREGRNVDETAYLQGRKPATIIQHIEELLMLGKVSHSDITHLARGKEKIIAEIQETFRVLGAERLKPVYDRLGGRAPYEIISLARLLFYGQ